QAEARMQTAVDTEHELRAQLAESSTRGKQKSSDADAARAAATGKQVAALTADLEAERRVVADLRSANAKREQRWENERSAQAERITEQLAALTVRLETEQRLTADLRRREHELEARIASEKATNADLRQDMQHAQERGHGGNQDLQSVRESLAHARAEVQSLRDELEAARVRVETALGERADSERLLQESETRLKRAVRERDELAARVEGGPHHESAKAASGSDTSKSLPAGTPLHVLPAPAAKAGHHKNKPVAKLKNEDAWVAVRLAPRYGFSEPIAVQINGTASQLCDLSIGGCQVLSQTALKPNQTVKVTIPGMPKAIACSGKIVWAKLEAPALGKPAGY